MPASTSTALPTAAPHSHAPLTNRGIYVIAPSGVIAQPQQLEQASAYLKTMGYTVKIDRQVTQVHDRFAGTDAQRLQAPALQAQLQQIRGAIGSGQHDTSALEKKAIDALTAANWQVDYVAIRRQRDLLVPSLAQVAQGEPLVVLAAAKLGATRLIDNLEI